MATQTQVLERTLSDVSSIADSSSATSRPRTRKRFTTTQLTMLEQLFHQNSHPTRHDREAVAKAGDMEIKSVTIWFQNKRQTERKSKAAQNNPPAKAASYPPTAASSARSRSAASPNSLISLDKIASRSEHRVDTAPSTPRRRDNNKLWENMDSSPVGPRSSPVSPDKDYVELAQNKRTLEWACASARLREKRSNSNHNPIPRDGVHRERRPKHTHQLSVMCRDGSGANINAADGGVESDHEDVEYDNERDEDHDTEIDDQDSEHEAITPSSSQDANDMKWAIEKKDPRTIDYASYSTQSYISSSFRKNSTTTSSKNSSSSSSSSSTAPRYVKVKNDDDFFAALTLCSLSSNANTPPKKIASAGYA